MQNMRFMPAAQWNPAFLGPVRLAGAPVRRGLAQGWGVYTPPTPSNPPPLQQTQDLPRVATQKELAEQPWTKEQAINAFNAVNLYKSIVQKVKFSQARFGNLWSDPKTSAAYQQAGKGQALQGAVGAVNDLVRALTLPNTSASASNLWDALTVNVLPKFGIEARGFNPLFRTSGPFAGTIDCVRFGGTGASSKEILDAGNLCDTGFFTDIEAFNVSAKALRDIAPEIKLSGHSLGIEPVSTTTVILILGLAALISAMTVYFVNRSDVLAAAKAPIENPEVRQAIFDGCNQLPPAQRAECINNAMKNADLYKKTPPPSDVWMWLGIGVGAIAVTWIVSTLAQSGVFGKGKAKD